MILSYTWVEQAWFLAIAVLVLFLPGLAWISWSRRGERDLLELLADAAAISVAGIAICGLVFFLFKWQFTALIIFLLFTICLLIFISGLLRQHVVLTKRQVISLLGTLVLLGAAVFWRLDQARGLALPAWVDSVPHMLVVQKIIDASGLPPTLGPELPVLFTYHYGFHILTALWSAISQLNPTDAVLWFGQVLNAALVLGIYRVGKAVWKNSRIALIGALLATFALQMPAYYLSWGRYTLITGLICMLPAMAASMEIVQRNATSEKVWRLIILVAGLALVHYMALLFLGLFIACLLLERLITLLRCRRKKNCPVSSADLWRLALAALAGIVLALPWLLRMLQAMAPLNNVTLNIPAWQDFQNKFQYILYLLGPRHNYYLLGGAALGLLLSWFQPRVRMVALWSTLLVVMSIPWGWKLGPFRPDHMAIMLFLPGSWLLAGLLVWLSDQLARVTGKRLARGILIVAVSALLIWGAWNTRAIVNSTTILAMRSDRQALDWIKANTPTEARFFANTTNWQFDVWRGVDGGYWVTPYTRRFSVAMPALYTSGETEQLARWKDWQKAANEVTTCDESFWALVRSADLDYIYVHDGRGNLQSVGLENCETISLVYDSEQVKIYKIYSLP